jgi:hypothetical protein
MRISIGIALLMSTLTMFGQADFTGKWKLNLDRTQFNEVPGGTGAARLVVEQSKGTIKFQRDDRAKETLQIDSSDGIEIPTGGIEGSKTKVSMKSTDDKKGLIETRIYSYPESVTAEVEAKKTRTWILSPDKNTLTIKDHIETTGGRVFDMILIYDRQ